MNGATYRTNREALGLSVRGAARFHGISERTLRHWEAAEDVFGLPRGAYDELAELDRRMTDAANMMCDDWRNRDFPRPFVVFRYNDPQQFEASPLATLAPFEAQGMLVHRIRQALERAGATVEIRYGDKTNI